MTNFSKKFIVKPGKKIQLKQFSTDSPGEYRSHKKAELEIKEHLVKMDRLQYLMYANNRHSLLIVLQGLDAAGKDGVIRHVLTGMNPQGCTVTAFKQPTLEESDHDFLWRIYPHTPRKGTVAIFNRSHYEDVLVTRVHDLISKEECQKRYDIINDFERTLFEEGHTTILKFFLHISKEEQLDRFGKRLDDPTRQWKISEGDYKEREYWNAYEKTYEELLQNTSVEHAPWYIIPSDKKWFRNLVISKVITETLESLNMKLPRSHVDLVKIRRKYHAAKKNKNT